LTFAPESGVHPGVSARRPARYPGRGRPGRRVRRWLGGRSGRPWRSPGRRSGRGWPTRSFSRLAG